MTPYNPARRLQLVAGALLLVNCLLGACKATEPTPSEPTTQAHQTYRVRGIVARLDAQARVAEIQHEAIPEFANERGEKVGMPAMTMPFHLSSHVASNELGPGDKVEFSLEVRWGHKHELFIPSLSRLPPETEIRVK